MVRHVAWMAAEAADGCCSGEVGAIVFFKNVFSIFPKFALLN